MKPNTTHPLTQFLRQDLNLSEDAIALATRQAPTRHHLPMVLWQYGLVSLSELERIWDWESSEA
ncbi:hypothetical protein AY599_19360 [Leptolyngbya valderiana BDU 20041]|uniref:DUF2949 domain-containing protein n=1 Tax=Baaleninema simplex TaxID=2862350 RepID=UPI00034B9B05|nr:DUF2949 domain-containing protein [Baaleninema simplex]OAB62815.1 hypothetical protein AY599_19360 [Leptolyngbya valderiana BDU 20041]